MAFPKTFAELTQAKYKFDNHAKCRGCHKDIEWWITPTGKKMPFNLMPDIESPAVSHFATCPDAEEFRRSKVVR